MKDLKSIMTSYKSILIAKKHLIDIDKKLNTQYAKLFDLEFRLEREFEEVKRLQNLSVYNLFHTVLGNKEEQYQIEKQEYLLILMQYKECKNIVELLEFEKDILVEKISHEDKVVEALKDLSDARLQEISQKYPGIVLDIKYLDKKWEEYVAYQQELTEALDVGRKGKKLFTQMIELLKESRRTEEWGYSDRVKIYKGTNLDKALKLAFKANTVLQDLANELEDIYQAKNISTAKSFPEFSFFNDIYYDRLISDWIVQKRIVSAITHLFGTLETIKSIIKSLEIEMVTIDKQIKYVDERKKSTIFEYLKDEIKRK